MTTLIPPRVVALARACSPLRWLALDLRDLDLDLVPQDLLPVRERPWPRWPTPWPGYRGDAAA